MIYLYGLPSTMGTNNKQLVHRPILRRSRLNLNSSLTVDGIIGTQCPSTYMASSIENG